MFSKKHRIPRDQIKKVISEGQKGYSELFLIKKTKNNLKYNRFAFVVSKKVSKRAFLRTLVKRKIRSVVCEFEKKEILTRYNDGDMKGNDFLFILNPKMKEAKRDLVLNELNKKLRFMVE
jgi:ribonuclease P protein component